MMSASLKFAEACGEAFAEAFAAGMRKERERLRNVCALAESQLTFASSTEEVSDIIDRLLAQLNKADDGDAPTG